METATIDKLFLELSQVTQAKTPRELHLEDLLRSAHAIAVRKGENTAWERFAKQISDAGIGAITPKTFRVPPGDEDNDSAVATAPKDSAS